MRCCYCLSDLTSLSLEKGEALHLFCLEASSSVVGAWSAKGCVHTQHHHCATGRYHWYTPPPGPSDSLLPPPRPGKNINIEMSTKLSRMLAGVLSKIGVLRGVLARVPTEVSMKENNRKNTSASTLQNTPVLESTPASILESYLGVFPLSTSLPGQEVP